MHEIFDFGASKVPSGAEASSVRRVRENPYSALLPDRFSTILAAARQRPGGTWACEVFLALFKTFGIPRALLLILNSNLGEAFVSQPYLPFILVVTHTIGAGASIASSTSKLCPASIAAPGLAYSWEPGLLTCNSCTQRVCTLLALRVHISYDISS